MTTPRPARLVGPARATGSLAALLWLALWNGYPLLHFDTGAYVNSAFDRLAAPVDRPLVYGWFIFLASLNASPWLVVLAQAALVLWVLRVVLRVVDPAADAVRAGVCVLATAALSSAPLFVGQLTPDVFSGLLPLALFLLIAGFPLLTRIERWGLAALVAFGVGSHTSHVAMAAATIAALALTQAWTRRRETAPSPVFGAGLAAAIAATGLACVVVAATNYAQHGRFALAPGAHVFLVARLLADGPAARHLQRACPQAGYRLCAHLDALPKRAVDYIWYGDLLERTGGWLGSRDESWTIIRRTVAEEPGAVLDDALAATAQQLASIDALANLAPIPNDHGALRTLAARHPGDADAIRASRQQRGEWPSPALRTYDALIRGALAVFALAACVLAWRRRAQQPELLQLVVACGVFYVVNAFVCGALSGIDPRYQARVSWPLAFVGIALVARIANGRRQWQTAGAASRIPRGRRRIARRA